MFCGIAVLSTIVLCAGITFESDFSSKLSIKYLPQVDASLFTGEALKIQLIYSFLNCTLYKTKMEGGTERHLPKTDDWRRRVHR